MSAKCRVNCPNCGKKGMAIAPVGDSVAFDGHYKVVRCRYCKKWASLDDFKADYPALYDGLFAW